MKNLLFAVAASVLVCSCATTRPLSQEEILAVGSERYMPEGYEWEEVVPGIEMTVFRGKDFNVSYRGVRVDLDTEGLVVEGWPDKSAGIGKDEFFKGIKTSTFARRNSCVVAVNASPFRIKGGRIMGRLGRARQIVGIHKVDGQVFSSDNGSFCALEFYENEEGRLRAKIAAHQSEEESASVPHAFGGFFEILRGSEIVWKGEESLNARTAAGLDETGRYLVILSVRGSDLNGSGLSYRQCAEVFQRMGCSDAMEFDGGNSTQLVVCGKNYKGSTIVPYQANHFGFSIR